MKLSEFVDREGITWATLADDVGCSVDVLYRARRGLTAPRAEVMDRIRERSRNLVTCVDDLRDAPEATQ